MRIQLVTPAGPSARNGNSITAVRWARVLKQLGHRVFLDQSYASGTYDCMIALHARRSAESIERFHTQYPDLPLIVALTGTDLYRDIRTNASAQQSLELATRLVVLQSMGIAELPKHLQAKTRVIYQSAPRVNGLAPPRSHFKVCVIGHLREEKDPLRTAMAVRLLPSSSRLRVLHIGRALNPVLGRRARRESARNPRYRWLGELSHRRTRRLLASSRLVVITSQMEGSSNVLSEAIASSVPVVASKIPGLIGTLGKSYPGYFSVGDTRQLAELLSKVESEPEFYRRLKIHCRRLFPLVDPKREVHAWRDLLAELGDGKKP